MYLSRIQIPDLDHLFRKCPFKHRHVNNARILQLSCFDQVIMRKPIVAAFQLRDLIINPCVTLVKVVIFSILNTMFASSCPMDETETFLDGSICTRNSLLSTLSSDATSYDSSQTISKSEMAIMKKPI